MCETNSSCIQGKLVSITGLRRSPRFIHPNQPQSDSEVPNSESSIDLVSDSSQKSSFDKSRNLRRSMTSETRKTCVSSKIGTKSATGTRRPARQNVTGEDCCFRRSSRLSIVHFKDHETSLDSEVPNSESSLDLVFDSSQKSSFDKSRKLRGSKTSETKKTHVRSKIVTKSATGTRRSAGQNVAGEDCCFRRSSRLSVLPFKELETSPKNRSSDNGKRITRSASRATAHKDNNALVQVYRDIVIGIMADPIRTVDKTKAHNQVDKKLVGTKRKFTTTVDVHPSVQETTNGEHPTVQGWTREQESALQRAYFSEKPTPHFWKRVAKMVPGKSAQECFEKINSDILTPPPHPQRRSVSKQTSSQSFSLSPSILLTPPTSKKSRHVKGKQRRSYKNARQLVNKQAKTEQKGCGADLFYVLEPSFDLSTRLVSERSKKGERSNDQSVHSDLLGGIFNSPPVLKKIKNKVLHEKYIDQLHLREAKRNVASQRATKGKNGIKESQVLKEEAIGRAKNSLVVNARSAINQFLELQSKVTSEFDDDKEDIDDREEDDELEE